MTNMDKDDFEIDLQSIEFIDDMEYEIMDGITTVIQPSSAPTLWYLPEIEELSFSQSQRKLDLYINIEVYWSVTDRIKEMQSSSIYENTMQGIMKSYFNNSKLEFSVDIDNTKLNDWSNESMILSLIFSCFVSFLALILTTC